MSTVKTVFFVSRVTDMETLTTAPQGYDTPYSSFDEAEAAAHEAVVKSKEPHMILKSVGVCIPVQSSSLIKCNGVTTLTAVKK